MICRKCGEKKNSEEFVNDKYKKNGKVNLCKVCKRNSDKISYEKRKESINIKKKKKIDLFRKTYQELKNNKCCLKCDETKHHLLDFHHKDDSKKDFNIGTEAWRCLNIEKIIKEIEKCVILCSNCHREFHYLEKENKITLDRYINKVP